MDEKKKKAKKKKFRKWLKDDGNWNLIGFWCKTFTLLIMLAGLFAGVYYGHNIYQKIENSFKINFIADLNQEEVSSFFQSFQNIGESLTNMSSSTKAIGAYALEKMSSEEE